MAKDIFAPPSEQELDQLNNDPIFAPPSEEELKSSVKQFATVSPSDISQLEAAARGLGQGATAGFSDEILAGLQAGKDVVTGEDELSNISSLYERYRDMERSKEAEAKEAYPKTYLASELGGGIGSAFIPGMQVKTLGQAAKLGGLTGLGMSEADLLQGDVKGAAIDTAIGTAGGLAGHKIGEAVSGQIAKRLAPATKKIGESAEREAGDIALSAMGANAKDIEKELGKAQGLLTEPEFRKGLGQEALNYTKFFSGPDKVRKAVNEDIKKIIDQKNPLLTKADESISKKLTSGELSKEDLARGSIKDELTGYLVNKSKEMQVTEINPQTIENISRNFQNYIDRVSTNDNNIQALENIRKQIGSQLSDKSFGVETRDLALQDEMLRKVYLTVKKRIEDLANLSGDNRGQLIKELNQKEGRLIDLNRIAFKEEARDIASKGNAGNMIAFGAGSAMAGGNPLGGLALLAGKLGTEKATGHTIPELGKIFAAKSAKKSGELAIKAGQGLEAITPEVARRGAIPATVDVTKQVEKSLTDNGPDTGKQSRSIYDSSDDDLKTYADILRQDPSLTKFADALQKSIDDNNQAVKNATLFSLMQNPKARQLIGK